MDDTLATAELDLASGSEDLPTVLDFVTAELLLRRLAAGLAVFGVPEIKD